MARSRVVLAFLILCMVMTASWAIESRCCGNFRMDCNPVSESGKVVCDNFCREGCPTGQGYCSRKDEGRDPHNYCECGPANPEGSC